MNIHTEPTSILSAFWRNGRKVFVPLTVRELIHQHGATAHGISAMVAAGLIRREEMSKYRETAICSITEAGRRLVPQPVAKAKPVAVKPPSAQQAKPAKRPAKPAPVLSVVQPYRVPDSLRHAYAGKPVSTSHIVAAMNKLAKHERRMGKLPNHRIEDPAEFRAGEADTEARLAVLRAIDDGATSIAEVATVLGKDKSHTGGRVREMIRNGLLLSDGPADTSKPRTLSITAIARDFMEDAE